MRAQERAGGGPKPQLGGALGVQGERCGGWRALQVLLAAGSKTLPLGSRPCGLRHDEPAALALTPMHPLADAVSIHRCE